jgi:hypothetical protein
MTAVCNLRAPALNLLFVSIFAAIPLNVGINLMFSPLHDGRHGEWCNGGGHERDGNVR